MPFSISGNAGVAGALVHYGGDDTFVTADGSGNYSIPALANGTYEISPALANYAFTPPSRSVTVNNANVTGVNFTAANPTVTLTLTPISTDAFTPNANPLNPTNWQQVQGSGVGEFEPLQALNGTCVASSDDSTDFGELWIGSSTPGNQYVSIKLNSIVADGSTGFAAFLRSSADFQNQYEIGIFSVDSTHLRCVMSVFVAGTEYDFASLESFTFSANDAFVFAVVGTDFYLLQNGTSILHGSDSNFATGLAGLNINPFTLPNASAVVLSNFIVGSASTSSAYSYPDDRNFGVFPNNAVNVQGTLQYTVPAHPSTTTPVDSRASKPVDSRIAADIPQNSRTTPH